MSCTDDNWTPRPEQAKRFKTIGHARNWGLTSLGRVEPLLNAFKHEEYDAAWESLLQWRAKLGRSPKNGKPPTAC